jgi:hypothetical protein
MIASAGSRIVMGMATGEHLRHIMMFNGRFRDAAMGPIPAPLIREAEKPIRKDSTHRKPERASGGGAASYSGGTNDLRRRWVALELAELT